MYLFYIRQYSLHYQPSFFRAHMNHVSFRDIGFSIEMKWDLCFMGSTTGILNTIMWPDSLRSTTDSDPCGGKVVIVSAMLPLCCVLPKCSPCGRLRHRIATGKLTILATSVQTKEDKHKPVPNHVSISSILGEVVMLNVLLIILDLAFISNSESWKI